jgi:protein-tyrosine phosphatase
MIDIHSHILPGVDDGARTLDEALDMLRMAADQGVTKQVLTPHIHYGRYENTKADLEQHFNRFVADVDAANINIELQLAAEVRIGTEVMQLAAQDAIPYLGIHNDKKVFLLEFPRVEVPVGSDNLVKWLINKGYMPLIVHPERNQTFVNHPHKLKQLTDMGCYTQVTASSLTGNFGDDVKAFAIKMIENDEASAIASDCHNLKGRKPDLGIGQQLVCELFSSDVARQLTYTNPQQLT